MEPFSLAQPVVKEREAKSRVGLYVIRTLLLLALFFGVIQVALMFGPARVKVRSNAPDTFFYVDGRLCKKDSAWTLPPYEKSIQIHASGYWPQVERVRLRPFRTTTIDVSLERSEGLLTITGFEQGTIIIIDGSLEYACPVTSIRLPVGQHVLRARSPLHGSLVCGITLSAEAPLIVPATEFWVDGR